MAEETPLSPPNESAQHFNNQDEINREIITLSALIESSILELQSTHAGIVEQTATFYDKLLDSIETQKRTFVKELDKTIETVQKTKQNVLSLCNSSYKSKMESIRLQGLKIKSLYSASKTNLPQLAIPNSSSTFSPPSSTTITSFSSPIPAVSVPEVVSSTILSKKSSHEDSDLRTTVYACGSNEHHQLAMFDDTFDRFVPEEVEALTDRQVVDVVCGEEYSLALTASNKVLAWGANSFGQLGLGTLCKYVLKVKQVRTNLKNVKIVKLGAGKGHSVALSDSGECYAWGYNVEGQLGQGDEENCSYPRKVGGVLEGHKVKDIKAGYLHVLVLLENKEVFAWGRNNCGQLGLGDNLNYNTPQRIAALSGKNIVNICAPPGGSHSLALSDTGQVYVWGLNNNGQLGLNDQLNRNSPTLIESLKHKKIIKIFSGLGISLVLAADGKLYGFGRNDCCQLSRSDVVSERLIPEEINWSPPGEDLKISKVTVGWDHCLVITDSGRVFIWGANSSGQLGFDDDNHLCSTEIVSFKNKNVIAWIATAVQTFIIANTKGFPFKMNSKAFCDVVIRF